MKHTYLYPLPAKARFLWMLGRTDTADLFGFPERGHEAGLVTSIKLDEVFARARSAVHRIILDAPGVCIGEGYCTPGTLMEDGGRHHALTPSVERLTEVFWDAPSLTKDLLDRTLVEVWNSTAPGRDEDRDINRFLVDHYGQHIIPVWM